MSGCLDKWGETHQSLILCSGPLFALIGIMKAVAVNRSLSRPSKNFYISNLAPVNYRKEIQFRAVDAVMLIVLFLEIAAVMRLLLAK
jgi:hypothetical protein